MVPVLVTGGAGYVGVHVCAALSRAGHAPVIADSFANADEGAPDRVAALTGRPVAVERLDVRDTARLADALRRHGVEAVIHLAGLKGVFESRRAPQAYFSVNVGGLLSVTDAMARAGVDRLVFSSSASVYAEDAPVPFHEDGPTFARHPYGAAKLVCERALRDLGAADPGLAVGVLRYFNPAGADPSGVIGEPASARPRSLFAALAEAAMDREGCLDVFGGDYPTTDGTALRDFIHIDDLARAHVLALTRLLAGEGGFVCNIGAGKPVSVRQAAAAYAAASGRDIPIRLGPRRPGDLPVAFADTERARAVLGFTARSGLDEICASDWNWSLREAARGDPPPVKDPQPGPGAPPRTP